MSTILVINGPNLNLLGTRETNIYGAATLDEIIGKLTADGSKMGHKLTHLQSNAEHELVDIIQESRDKVDFIIINPAAFTHTSVALRDALLAVKIPFIELHLSNTDAREEFRTKSYLSDIALGKISGFGPYSYDLALMAANDYLTNESD
ncbi:MAG: type II 3-dehydroquinate dehydratase [Coxiella sp. (in: Bacteria)]|nr:MAG: type II 3-dehydroquinate dehydratase [Coxiella sp. (in: g-proteobacteria)]